jgi:hypothetical protein
MVIASRLFRLGPRGAAGLASLTVLALVAVLATPVAGQARYPGKSWERATSPAELGWSPDKLRAAREYAATLDTAAVMIVVDGLVLDEWGETARRYNIHSIRKKGRVFSARGAGGHYIMVVPYLSLVVVHRVDTDVQGRRVTGTQFGHLMQLIMDAKR